MQTRINGEGAHWVKNICMKYWRRCQLNKYLTQNTWPLAWVWTRWPLGVGGGGWGWGWGWGWGGMGWNGGRGGWWVVGLCDRNFRCIILTRYWDWYLLHFLWNQVNAGRHSRWYKRILQSNSVWCAWCSDALRQKAMTWNEFCQFQQATHSW